MGTIIDVNKLGVRKKKRTEYKHSTGMTTTDGHSQMVETVIETEETQPVLNKEEALLLVEADWKPTPASLAHNGAFMCVVSGRRFFTAEKPVKPKPKAKSGSKGTKKTTKPGNSPVSENSTD